MLLWDFLFFFFFVILWEMSLRSRRVYYFYRRSKLVKREDRHVESEAGEVLHAASDKNEREP